MPGLACRHHGVCHRGIDPAGDETALRHPAGMAHVEAAYIFDFGMAGFETPDTVLAERGLQAVGGGRGVKVHDRLSKQICYQMQG